MGNNFQARAPTSPTRGNASSSGETLKSIDGISMSQIIARARVEAGLARAEDLQDFFLVQSVFFLNLTYLALLSAQQ